MKLLNNTFTLVCSVFIALSACDNGASGGDDDDDDGAPVGGTSSGGDGPDAGSDAGGSSGTSAGGAETGGSAGATGATGGSAGNGGSAGSGGSGGEGCPAAGCPAGSYCDLSTDRCEPGCALDEHCGTNEACDPSSHECGCSSGHMECDAVCVNVDTSRTDCGACGNACADDEICTAGECEAPPETCPPEGCPTGSYCDLGTNRCEIGCALDDQCGTNSRCNLTTHTCECISGYHDCSGVCVGNSRPETCGTSCTPCAVPDNGRATCTSGQCGLTCNSTFTLCAGLCETTPLCEKQDGVCAGTLKQCPGGTGWVCPTSYYTAHAATYEVTEVTCDSLDNDCDAQTDEGLLSACGTCSAAPTETCNGLDDDCDGTPDQLPQCAACSAPPYEFTGDPPWDLALLNDETYVVTFDTAMKFANAQPLWTVDLLSAPDQMNTGPLILAHNGAVHLAAGREWRTVTGTTTIIQDVTAHATLNLQTGAPSWTRVDPSSNTRTPLALTGTGDTIAIVYTDDAAMNRARLATRVGTAAFTLVGSMTVGVLTWVGAAYNTAGQLHVLYSSNPSNINYRHNVAHSVWGGAAQSAFGSLGYIYSLELDPGPNGSLHTAFTYYEDGQGGTPHTQYLRFDGTNLVPSASEELSWLGGRLGFDQSGQILMIHGAASELLLSRRLASGTWESQPLRSVTGHTLSGYALKVDSVGRHHILYDDVDDATGAERYFYVVACPNWE